MPTPASPILCPRCLAGGSRRLRVALPRDHVAHTFRPTVRGLVEHAAILTGIPAADLLSPKRSNRETTPRKAVCWVAHKVSGQSYPVIGKILGGRDHSTIIHACRAADILIEREPEFAWLCERLWAAGECEPLGPAVPFRIAEPEPEPGQQAESEAKPAPPPRRPVPPPRVRVVEGEYTPRHALPPVMAVVDDELLTLPHDDDTKRARYRSAEASNAMLDALRRARPESAIA